MNTNRQRLHQATPTSFSAKTLGTTPQNKRSGGLWPVGEYLPRAKLQGTETTEFNTAGTHH